jgi:hypothetical protein
LSSDKRGTSRDIADANFNSLIAQRALAAVTERDEQLWLAKADVYTNEALEAMMIGATTDTARDNHQPNRCLPMR